MSEIQERKNLPGVPWGATCMYFTSYPLTNIYRRLTLSTYVTSRSDFLPSAVVYGAFQACFLLEIWGENQSLLSLIGASVSYANHGFGLGSVPRYLWLWTTGWTRHRYSRRWYYDRGKASHGYDGLVNWRKHSYERRWRVSWHICGIHWWCRRASSTRKTSHSTAETSKEKIARRNQSSNRSVFNSCCYFYNRVYCVSFSSELAKITTSLWSCTLSEKV